MAATAGADSSRESTATARESRPLAEGLSEATPSDAQVNNRMVVATTAKQRIGREPWVIFASVVQSVGIETADRGGASLVVG